MRERGGEREGRLKNDHCQRHSNKGGVYEHCDHKLGVGVAEHKVESHTYIIQLPYMGGLYRPF